MMQPLLEEGGLHSLSLNLVVAIGPELRVRDFPIAVFIGSEVQLMQQRMVD